MGIRIKGIIKYSMYVFLAVIVSFLGFLGVKKDTSGGDGYVTKYSPLSLFQVDICSASDQTGDYSDGDDGDDSC